MLAQIFTFELTSTTTAILPLPQILHLDLLKTLTGFLCVNCSSQSLSVFACFLEFEAGSGSPKYGSNAHRTDRNPHKQLTEPQYRLMREPITQY